MRSHSSVLVLLATIAMFVSARSAPMLQKDRWQEPPYVPLSSQVPAAVSALPEFGIVEWSAGRLPFIAEGPLGGISGMGIAVYEGNIYIAGGFTPGGDGSDDRSRATSRWSHRYDPAARTWTQLPDLPARREYCRALPAAGGIYMLGGATIRGRKVVKGEETTYVYAPYSDCFLYDVKQGAWRNAGNLSVPRTHMAAGRVGNKLIVAGGNEYNFERRGYDHSTIRDTTDVLDLSRPGTGWRKASPIPGGGRGWCGAAACRGRLFVFAGLTFSEKGESVRLRETWAYDPEADRWSAGAPFPLKISGWGGATFADRYVVLLGGVAVPDKIESQVLWNDVAFVYDAQTDRWMKLKNPMPPGAVFNDPGVCIINDTVYVLGAEGPRGSHFNHFLQGRIRPRS